MPRSRPLTLGLGGITAVISPPKSGVAEKPRDDDGDDDDAADNTNNNNNKY